MINRKKIMLGCCLLCLGTTGLKAQSGSVAAGGDATGSGGSSSYTVGQVDCMFLYGAGESMGEGIQQPFEIQVISGMEETGINLSASVYPNPSTDFVVLSIDDEKFQHLSYALYDVQGRLLGMQKISSRLTTISMKEWIGGSYFIKVLNDNTEIKLFKIINTK